MRLTSQVPHQERILRRTNANSRSDGTSRKPGPFEASAPERLAHAQAGRLNVPQNRLAGSRLSILSATLLQLVATEAAGEAHAAPVAVHHAPVASGKDQQRHHTNRKLTLGPMRLEGEQIRR